MEDGKNKKIVLPETLQISMLKFFLRTSIPRIAKQSNSCPSKKKDRCNK